MILSRKNTLVLKNYINFYKIWMIKNKAFWKWIKIIKVLSKKHFLHPLLIKLLISSNNMIPKYQSMNLDIVNWEYSLDQTVLMK